MRVVVPALDHYSHLGWMRFPVEAGNDMPVFPYRSVAMKASGVETCGKG
jgi:hypothetical protein